MQKVAPVFSLINRIWMHCFFWMYDTAGFLKSWRADIFLDSENQRWRSVDIFCFENVINSLPLLFFNVVGLRPGIL